MKKIIVPVDFSEHSEYAMEVAASLAKIYNAEVIALHMLEIANTLISASAVKEYPETLLFMKMAKKRFEEFLDKDYLEEIKVTDIVQYHKVFSEVNETAINHDADLIVMGSHGASGTKELFLGSNAEKVVRNANIPVLVIKKRISNFSISTALHVSDFKTESIDAYLKMKLLFKHTNISIQSLYINTPYDSFKSSDEIQSQIEKFIKKVGDHPAQINNIDVINHYTIEKGAIYYANKNNYDLIIIATHGRKGISHFLSGSIGEDLVNHANLPVMTFKI